MAKVFDMGRSIDFARLTIDGVGRTRLMSDNTDRIIRDLQRTIDNMGYVPPPLPVIRFPITTPRDNRNINVLRDAGQESQPIFDQSQLNVPLAFRDDQPERMITIED